MAFPAREVPDLHAAIESLLEWMRSMDGAVAFTDVRIVDPREVPDPAMVMSVAESVESFAQTHWPRIVADVDRSWINLRTCGVLDGVMIVAVEWIDGLEHGEGFPGPIAVTVGGFPGQFRWLYGPVHVDPADLQ